MNHLRTAYFVVEIITEKNIVVIEPQRFSFVANHIYLFNVFIQV